MSDCPSPMELERALDGSATSDELARVERHRTSCETCAGWLREAADDEAFAHDLRDALEGEEAPAGPAPGPLPGRGLARYRFLRLLGSGGMGVVWEAEQEHPRRRVALKLMKSGVSGARARQRFAAEARLLGRLEHPGIARILEADTFEVDGEERPFFAMELVEGLPLDRWARERSDGLRQRLELFVALAEAVHHAHQKGVLHRDLKPANVLVTVEGRPKVLDFGVARSLEAEEDGPTEPGLLVGTLASMAPEQVSGDPAAVDTRADVYALGALLHELVAGAPPLDVAGLPLADAVARILHEPPRPLRALAQGVDRDLETIVATALAKDRERRYPSAEALGSDVRRWLAREPIAARPATRGYVLLRFVQRHRALVGLSALALVLLVAGLTAALVQRDRALASERSATLRGQALAARSAELETERARLEQVVGFLVRLLGGENPEAGGRGHAFTVREALDEAALRLDDGSIDDPEVEATLRLTLGGAYRTLGEHARAARHLERGVALRRAQAEDASGSGDPGGPADTELAQGLNALAALRWEEGRSDEAVELWSEAVLLYEASDDPLDAARRAASVSNLAVAELTRGHLAEGEALAREALAVHEELLGREDHAVANDLALVANAVGLRGDPEEAERLLREALAVHAAAPEPETLYTATTHWLLGSLLLSQGRFAEAAEAFERSLAIRERILGPDHPDVRSAAASLEAALARVR